MLSDSAWSGVGGAREGRGVKNLFANLQTCGENAGGLDSGIAFICLLAAEILRCFISLTIVVALKWTGRVSGGCV